MKYRTTLTPESDDGEEQNARAGSKTYLCELKGPIRQQRCDPVGTFGQVAVELGRRFDSVLRHVLMDVL